MQDRTVIYCVNVPAENDWVQQQNGAIQQQPPTQQSTQQQATVPQEKSKKRQREEDPMDEDEDSQTSEPSKKPKVAAKQPTNNSSQGTQVTYLKSQDEFPLPSKHNMACMVKLYQPIEVKMCEVYEFVGILAEDAPVHYDDSVFPHITKYGVMCNHLNCLEPSCLP